MRIIEADLPRTWEPAFRSAEAAIESAKLTNALRAKGTGSGLCIGRKVISGSWDNERVVLRLEGDRLLFFWCERDTVQWTESDNEDVAFAQEAFLLTAVLIRLNDAVFPWDRAELMKRMSGRGLLNIHAGSRVVFLYLDSMPTVCFSVLIDRATKLPFLYWCECE